MRLLANNNNERKHMSDFTWSYSSLKQYQNCPKQYQEIRVLKNYTIKEREAMIYGMKWH